MAFTVGELIGYLRLDSQNFKKGLGDMRGETRSTGAFIGKAMGGAAVVAGAAIAGFAAEGVKQFAGFEQDMNKVFSLMPDASKASMDKLTADVRAFSTEMGVATSEVVPALYEALSAGVPQDNVISFMETAQKTAMGGVTDLTTAVDGLTSVVNAYGADTIDASTASDVMFQTVKLGKASMEELSGSLYNVLPTASALGVGFQDVGSALAAMTAQGVPTSVATTQMRSLLVELSKEGTKTSGMFKELSGKSFKEFVAEGGSVQGALQLLERNAAQSGVGINDLFGSVEAGSAALTLTGKGTATFTDFIGQMKNSAGATDAAYKQMDQGLSRSMQRIKVSFGSAAMDVGESLAPALKTVAEWVQAHMPAFQAAVGNAIAFIGRAIKGATALWDEHKSWLIPTLKVIVTVLKFVGSVIIDSIVGVIKGALQFLRGAFNVIGGLFDFIKALVTGDWAGMWTAVKRILGGAIDMVLGAIKVFLNWGVFSIFRKGLFKIVGLWKGGWSGLWTLVKTWFGKIRGSVGSGVTGVVSWFKSLPGRILDALKGIGKFLFESGKSLLSGFLDGIKHGFENVKNKLGGLMQGIRDFFPFSPAREGPFSGSGWVLYSGQSIGEAMVDGLSGQESSVRGAADRLMRAARTRLDAPAFNSETSAWGKAQSRDSAGARTLVYVTQNNPVAEPATKGINNSLGLVAALGR